MPGDLRGQHETHCCPLHGCKYGDEDCPVAALEIEPKYPKNNGCEECEEFFAAAEAIDWHRPVEIPFVVIFKLVTRWERMKQLKDLASPKIIMDEEEKLIEKGLDDLKAYAIEHGIIVPRNETLGDVLDDLEDEDGR
jgi:hypothetical protein